MRAADPRQLVRGALSAPWLIGPLTQSSAVNVIAVGKAAGPMLDAFAHGMDRPLRMMAAIGPGRSERLPSGAEWFESSHPLPDARSVRAARRALDIAAATGPGDLLIVLLSGGASALMALPAEGITLEDKQDTIGRLLRGGATIGELNTVRKHLSAIKGGRLAAATPAPVVTLVISDVVDDDLSVIGSGPTMPDPSTFEEALAVLDRRGGRTAYGAAVVAVLERGRRGEVPETLKPDDLRLTRSVARIIGGRMTAVEGAAAAARARGFDVHVIERPIVGEARDAARRFTDDTGREALAHGGLACVIGAGETTVHVKGHGLGGRNQEFALAMLANLPERSVAGLHCAFGSIGTDGIDGPTDAAGAIVDTTTGDRAAALGLDPQLFLDNNDSYHFFSALDDLLRTGPTGTNVGDVQVLLIAS